MKKVVVLGLGLMSIALSGCQGDERIGEVSTKQFEAEQQARAVLVDKMERDLTRRNRFYQGVAGTYEGTATSKSASYKIRIRLVRSVPTVVTDRVRMQEEVAADINSLSFSAQIVMWSPQSSVGSVGCQVSGIKPDIENGRIEFAPSECGNYFLIQINDASVSTTSRIDEIADRSRTLARSLMTGRSEQVAVLNGVLQPTSTSEVMSFSAERVAQ